MADARIDRRGNAPDADTLIAELAEAHERLANAQAAVEEVGESDLQRLDERLEEAERLLNKYESSATGTGDFESFMRFRGKFGTHVETLPDDLPTREAFEAANDAIDKRRLSESDFERARRELDPARELARRLEVRETARSAFDDVRYRIHQRLEELADRIDDLQRLEELDAIDLDAPTGEIREPVEAYNTAVRNAFQEYRQEASARDVIRFIEATDHYPLVDFRLPPPDLREYVEQYEAGAKPLSTLLEYADYSRSKLDHYVDDPAALRTRVATHRTYLDRLDAEPLTIEWPPPPAQVLRYRARELVSVVARFAGDPVTTRARRLRDLAGREDYTRLRRAAEAEAELTETERERLASGAVSAELSAAQDERDRLRTALDEYAVG